MFTKKEIATYYNHTLLHYRVGWQLDKSKGLHYGLWYPDTKNLHEAIQNTNKKIGSFIKNKDGFDVLDAGCGVGGSAIFLAQNYHCNVHGITLSKAQLNTLKKLKSESKCNFQSRIILRPHLITKVLTWFSGSRVFVTVTTKVKLIRKPTDCLGRAGSWSLSTA